MNNLIWIIAYNVDAHVPHRDSQPRLGSDDFASALFLVCRERTLHGLCVEYSDEKWGSILKRRRKIRI